MPKKTASDAKRHEISVRTNTHRGRTAGRRGEVTKPIAPDDVVLLKTTQIPDEVFAAFNECIARHFSGRSATFTQDEVLAEVRLRLPEDEHAHIFQRGWLDVEQSYGAVGWLVSYDKPRYNETYAATFTFAKPRLP